MTEFEEILEFAISREKEAVEFYRELQGVARFKAQVTVLKEFGMMELGHVKLLEGVKERRVFKERRIPRVDLRLSDYLVEVKPAADMSYQDILIAAIKKEERSMALYEKLARETGDDEAASVFETLRAEEANHKNHFEKIYDEEILADN